VTEPIAIGESTTESASFKNSLSPEVATGWCFLPQRLLDRSSSTYFAGCESINLSFALQHCL
jgi:hypothetical protein